MTNSILNSTKKVLGIDANYTAFDLDILMHINSTFSTLEQLGLGPVGGFMIEDAEPTWDAFFGSDHRLNAIKTYVYLRVRVLFDPPATSFVLTAIREQIAELEWRLNVVREGDILPTPLPPSSGPFPSDGVLDGGGPTDDSLSEEIILDGGSP